jgi:hypothetical protein
MTGPMIIEAAKSFYDEMKITEKCTIPERSNKKLPVRTLISRFCRDVDEIRTPLEYYVASCGNCLLTFQDDISVPLSRNVSKQLPHNAA